MSTEESVSDRLKSAVGNELLARYEAATAGEVPVDKDVRSASLAYLKTFKPAEEVSPHVGESLPESLARLAGEMKFPETKIGLTKPTH